MIRKTIIPPDGEYPTLYKTSKINDNLYKSIPSFKSNDYDIDRVYGPFNLMVVFGDLLRLKYPVRKYLDSKEKPLPWVTFDHARPFLDDMVEHPPYALIKIKDQKIQMVVKPIKKPLDWPLLNDNSDNGEPDESCYAQEVYYLDDNAYRRQRHKNIRCRECEPSTGRLLRTYCLMRSGPYGYRKRLTFEEANNKIQNRKSGKPWQEC